MSLDFAAARYNMVESQVRPNDVTDLDIQDAMRAVPREALVPPEKAAVAYADAELEYAPGRWLLRPRDIAKLLQAVRPKAGETALAVAAPYAAKVLQEMGLSVTVCDDPRQIPAGPFDVIVSEGAVDRAPQAWLDALAEDGRLGVVERTGPQGRAMLYLRAGPKAASRTIFDSAAPLLPEFLPATGFAF